MPSWLTDLIKHTPLLQDAIETLYLYKLSMCFSVHFLLVVGLPICIMWVMIVLEKLKIESKEYPLSNSHSRVSRMDYAERCAQETQREVSKLMRSEQYKRYLRMGWTKRGRSLAQQVDEEIMSSDEQ